MQISKTVKIDFEVVFQNWYIIPTFYVHTELKEIGFEFLCFGLYFQIQKKEKEITLWWHEDKHTFQK